MQEKETIIFLCVSITNGKVYDITIEHTQCLKKTDIAKYSFHH